MTLQTYWRWHIDDPFDQFGFGKVWHCFVTPLEFGARQPISWFERRGAVWW
jgi:hypothetical protein